MRLACLAFLMLAGCAASQVQWEKPGASASALQADSEQCHAISRIAAPPARYTPIPGKSKSAKIMSRQEEVAQHDDAQFAQCMHARGYREKP